MHYEMGKKTVETYAWLNHGGNYEDIATFSAQTIVWE